MGIGIADAGSCPSLLKRSAKCIHVIGKQPKARYLLLDAEQAMYAHWMLERDHQARFPGTREREIIRAQWFRRLSAAEILGK
jgi:hypothetical protein